MTDERHGKPSCSALDRIDPDHCPASFAMGKEAERQGLVPPPEAVTESGKRIHLWLETRSPDAWEALSHDEKELAATCASQENRIEAEWYSADSMLLLEFRECRLGMTALGNVIHVTPLTECGLIVTGMADFIAVDRSEDRALVIDYKCGRLEVTEAKTNKQLLGLAALAALRWNLSNVRVAIVQPMLGPPTVADYDATALSAAAAWLEDTAVGAARIELESTPWAVGNEVTVHNGPPLKVGDWCQYCDGRAICPAFRDAATGAPDALAIETVPMGNAEHAVATMTARALALTPDEHAALLRGRRLRRWFELAIVGAARIRLERGESLPGFELREKAGRRKIEDTAAAVPALAPLLENAGGGPQAALLRCAQLRPKGLEEEIQKASGRKSETRWNLTQKEAEELLRDALGELMAQPKSMVLAECGMPLEYDEWEGGGE